MQWFGKGSGNIDDRRGMSGGKAIGGGIGIIVVILGLLFGKDFTGLVGQMPVSNLQKCAGKQVRPADAEGKFVDGVLESTRPGLGAAVPVDGTVHMKSRFGFI